MGKEAETTIRIKGGEWIHSRNYQSGRLDWGSGKISTNSSLHLQEISLGLVMSPATLLGSPDRIMGLQYALRGSCLLGFQLFFTFI